MADLGALLSSCSSRPDPRGQLNCANTLASKTKTDGRLERSLPDFMRASVSSMDAGFVVARARAFKGNAAVNRGERHPEGVPWAQSPVLSLPS